MNADFVISRILARIDAGPDADSLIEENVATTDARLLADAVAAFGSWPRALAGTLVHLRTFYERINQTAGADEDDGGSNVDDPRPERVVTGLARSAAFVLTQGGNALSADLSDFVSAETPATGSWAAPSGSEVPRTIVGGLTDSGVVMFTHTGKAVAADLRLLSAWSSPTVRQLWQRFEGLDASDRVVALFARSDLRAEPRFYTVSAEGQFKASDCSELRKLGSEAMAGALLKDDDTLLAAWCGPVDERVMLIGSHGRGIVFDASEVRSQGRKATGVRGIAIEGDARVVGAFAADPTGWVVIATSSGLMKRTRIADYRPQGRAGGGLQTCRLSGGERVVAAGCAKLDGDVIAVTSQGRWMRFPTWDVPFGTRAARGERCVELDQGEQIVALRGVVAG